MAWKRIFALACLIAAGTTTQADKENFVDFSDRKTPICEVPGLTAIPPDGWINFAIDSEDKAILGCQMMRAGELDDLVGIIRLLSIKLPPEVTDDSWFPIMVDIERHLITPMGYVLGDVMWSRESVPITGHGFKSAKAVGFYATIVSNDVQQEAQFLGFDGEANRYILTLLTPGRTVEGGSYYQRNTNDFGKLIQKGLNIKSIQ